MRVGDGEDVKYHNTDKQGKDASMSLSKIYLAGFLAYSGLCIPYFGHSFSFFGIHNRLLGLFVLIMAMLLGVRYFKLRRNAFNFFLLVAFFFLLLIIYSDYSQITQVFTFTFDQSQYYESKLSVALIVSIVPAIVGLVLSEIAINKEFRQGFVRAMLLWSLVAIIVGTQNSEYWFADYSKKAEWKNLVVFSQISMTILHLAGLVIFLVNIMNNKYIVFSVALFVVSSFFVIVYQQRSAWIYVILVTIYLFYVVSGSDIIKIIKRAILLSVVLLLGFIVAIKIGVFTDSVIAYADQLIRGEVLSTRTPMYMIAWNGFLDNPLGNGFGAFSISGSYARYPHNILLEALYELGIFGGVVILILLYISSKTILQLLRLGKHDLDLLSIGLFFGYLLIVSLKSGDMAGLELLITMTLMFSNYQLRNKLELTH
ncbi:O-antigen ligase-related protein [Candidatus Thiomargarita nelsonii]|uniref:O-antigen ligase-related protein n=1 Tax=Candidatus Thiomargarita nelsonii TaxID=1003181 RepID=A0A176S6B1_9GAMM|nr:O-antigen ligase-related protein [Candidatus Thiomargarita nelsonii]